MSSDSEDLLVITDPQEDRYASLRLIDWWKHDLVRSAHIMVVGAGALGNEVLKNLALLGVGHLFIADFDTIEASNLSRSLLYRNEDGGRHKALVATERVRLINPDVQVVAFNGDITRELGLGAYRRMDLVIACVDNRAARVAVNAACWNVQKPWVDGALDVQDGLIRAFIPPNGACYECSMTEQDYELLNLRYSCIPGTGSAVMTGRQPTMPTTAAIIAAMQVQQAMKLLHGQAVPTGNVIYYSWQAVRLREMRSQRRQDCPAHVAYDPIICLPNGVNDLTLGQFSEVIRPHIQEDGVIYLHHDIVTFFYCISCEIREDVYRPYHLVVPDQVPCPRCASLRTFDLTSALSTNDHHRDIPLAQLGIPALHILPVRTAAGWQYFEFSQDESTVLKGWQGKG